MNGAEVLDIGRNALWLTIQLSAPMLIVGLVVGVVIGLFQALTQIQCSTSVATGSVNFVIGHPIGIMAFPVINVLLPFDWLTNRNQAPRIFNDAALALFELPKPATTATTYNGMLYATSAAP